MATRHSNQGHPSVAHQLLEWRALFELASLPWLSPLLAASPRGDGHPVLLLPGFMAGETSMFALKLLLVSRGYRVETWGLGRNVGFHHTQAAALERKIRDMHRAAGRKVSLVGWSLGGLFAMHAAKQARECVRNVLTLGSPVSLDTDGASASPPWVKALYHLVARPTDPTVHVAYPSYKKLRWRDWPQIPVSCLYSLSDGVVPPQEATIHGNPARHENVRVPGSHIGLGFNAIVLWIVADRLAMPEGQWRPFVPQGPLGWTWRMLTQHSAPAWPAT